MQAFYRMERYKTQVSHPSGFLNQGFGSTKGEEGSKVKLEPKWEVFSCCPLHRLRNLLFERS